MKLSNVKFEELYNYCKSKNIPLLGNFDFSFLADYKKDYSTYDFGVNHDYSEFTILTNKTNIESVYDEWLGLINYIMLKNSYKYKKLFATLSLEYNPIENYSMTELGTDTRTPQLESNTTLTYGAETSNESTVDEVVPYDETNFTNRTKTNIDFSKQGKTDTNNTINSGNETTTHEFKRSGNIGVTTSQQMVESERRIAYFSFFKVLIRDIMCETCIIQDYVSWGCGE